MSFCRSSSGAVLLFAFMALFLEPRTWALEEQAADQGDWLEDAHNQATIKWVEEQSADTLRAVRRDSRFRENYARVLATVRLDTGLPGSNFHRSLLMGDTLYDFVRDVARPKGLWRRSNARRFAEGKPKWETVIDFEQASAHAGRPIRLEDPGLIFCYRQRCLLPVVVPAGPNESSTGLESEFWEFDLNRKSFVEGGFKVATSWGDAYPRWLDSDTLLVSGSAGPDSLTPDGRPRQIRALKRGQRIVDGQIIFESANVEQREVTADVLTGSSQQPLVIVTEVDRLKNSENFWQIYRDGRPARRLTFVPVGSCQDRWVGQLASDIERGASASWVSISMADFEEESPSYDVLFRPSAGHAFSGIKFSKDAVLLGTLDDVQGRVRKMTPEPSGWRSQFLPLPDNSVVNTTLADYGSDLAFASVENLLEPPTIYRIDVSSSHVNPIMSAAAQFPASSFVTEQLWATSVDGTQVPYFIVRPRKARLDGRVPTLLLGYGFGQNIQYPFYGGVLGTPGIGPAWLERGGAFVVANIRGGSEMGPQWWVVKADRRHTYDDFIAVAQDVVRRGITSPRYLGVIGHSNGGLPAGVLFNERPDLISAAVFLNPVLDQLETKIEHNGKFSVWARINASDYGLPEEPEGDFLRATSPYQNIKVVQSTPVPLLMSAANDNPFNLMARKFTSRLRSNGVPAHYYEMADAGHGFGNTPEQIAMHEAILYTYLAEMLMGKKRDRGGGETN